MAKTKVKVSQKVKVSTSSKGSSSKSIKKIVRAELKKQNPVEKKRQNYTMINLDQTMGQSAGNANAYWSDEITPSMTPAAGSNSRIGNEIAVTSAYMTLQLRQMPAATAPIKCVFYIYSPKGNYTDIATNSVTQLWNTNNFIGGGSAIYDTGSEMNIDQLANFRILKKFTVNLKPDQFSGQQMPVARSIGLKFKKPFIIRWNNSSANTQVTGRVFLVGFCSAGNASAATASTLNNICITTANTGVFINYNIKWYYTDQ